MPILELMIPGRCITKKSSQVFITTPKGKKFLIPKKAYREYEKNSIIELQSQLPYRFETIKEKIQVKALFWMPNHRGYPDLLGVLESIGDILEKTGIIKNDRNIISWDGSRIMGINKEDPRTEITLEVINNG